MTDTTLSFDIFARDHASRTFDKVGRSVDTTHKAFGGLKTGLVAIGGAFAGLAVISKVTGFLKDSVAEARESQKVGAQTSAVLKSTGHAANVTAKQIGNLATALSLKSGIDDEAIQSGENVLLTFRNIRNEAGKGNDIFNQTTKATLDMSVALGKDLRSSSIMVGKALNDPVKGITALGRAGVQFSEQQKKAIQQMVKSGDTMSAQKLILRELNKEFQGSAEAQATAGDKLKVAWENFKEQIGTALLPVIDKVATFLSSKVIPAVSAFISSIQKGKGAGGAFAKVFGTIKGAIDKVAPVIQSLIRWIRDDLAPAVKKLAKDYLTGLKGAWDNVSASLKRNKPMFTDIKNILSALGRVLVNNVMPALGKLYKDVWPAVGKAMGIVITSIHNQMRTWMMLWNVAIGPITKLILKAMAAQLEGWSKLMAALSHVPGFGWAKSAAKSMHDGAAAANGLANAIGKIPTGKNVNIKVSTPDLRSISSQLDWVARPRDARITVTKQYADAGRNTKGGLQRATGGFVSAGAEYKINEQGQEVFIPNVGGRVLNARETKQALEGGGSVDENKLARAVAKALGGMQLKVTGVEAGRQAYLITGGA